MWNRVVRRATEMTVERDLRPAYLKMCAIVNEYELGWQMSQFPELIYSQAPIKRSVTQTHIIKQQHPTK